MDYEHRIWNDHDIVEIILDNVNSNDVRLVCKYWCDIIKQPTVDSFFCKLHLPILAALGMHTLVQEKAKESSSRTIRKAFFFATLAHKNRTANMLKTFLPQTTKLMRKRTDSDQNDIYQKGENTVLWYYEKCWGHGQISRCFRHIPQKYITQDPFEYIKTYAKNYTLVVYYDKYWYRFFSHL